MNRLILFLIRKKLGLKLYERFRFTNQRSNENFYYFGKYTLFKVIGFTGYVKPSNVGLNYLLDNNCGSMSIK